MKTQIVKFQSRVNELEDALERVNQDVELSGEEVGKIYEDIDNGEKLLGSITEDWRMVIIDGHKNDLKRQREVNRALKLMKDNVANSLKIMHLQEAVSESCTELEEMRYLNSPDVKISFA